MRTVAPLQPMNLAKSFIIFFIVTSVAWIGANYLIFRDFYIGWPVLVANVLISGLVGWWWYKREYHAALSWDQQGFELQRGRGERSSRRWDDLSQVSLLHEGQGRFVVRVYENDGEYTDIPASDLKLEPSDFRFEVMELVKGRWPEEGARAPGKES